MEHLSDSQEINERVKKMWAVVFQHSNMVLRQASTFGFYCIQEIPDPNIHTMLVNMRVFSSVMEVIIASANEIELGYEQTRMLLNAKEQLTRMERLAAALKADNKEDYNKAIEDLERQATF